jgi:anti-sigma factor RsiW
MNARSDSSRLAAFVDGELSLEEQLAVEAQLQDDPAARAEVQALRALHDGLKRQADYHAAPSALRHLVSEQVRGEGVLGERVRNAAPRRSMWALLGSRLAAPWLAGAGGVAAALLIFSVFMSRPGASDADALLQQEAVAGHVRASLSQHQVDVASSDHHTVKPWLSARLDYSPPVPDLHLPGLVFDGARVDYLDGRRVAVLVYRQGQHQVDDYVWPSPATEGAAPKHAIVNGFRIAGWTQQGMRHCVVSDVNQEEFDALVAALRQAS